MKRLFTIVIIGFVLVSCKEDLRTDFVINGKAEGIYNGIRVYLKYSDEKGREIPIDTAIVFDEKFQMTGSVAAPAMHFLTVNNIQGKASFMLENSEIDISINKENILESIVKGSKTNKAYVEFNDGMKEIRDESQIPMNALKQIRSSEKTTAKDSLTKVLEQLGERNKAFPVKFIKENDDNDFSLHLIESQVANPAIDIIIYKASYDHLSSRLKATTKGKEIGLKLDEIYEKFKKTENLNIGKVAPNFEAPTPDGNLVSLNEIKGKVTIIDFWAAWCGPCRRENPNVVKVYEKYHDQGLEIIGVSLDGQSRQKDPKKAWLEAIEKDKLNWTQVSNLKYFNDPVAQLYNINAIPATFILDKDGKIVAKNLRGQALDKKVQELLAQ
jgi:peroxiredoxin